MKKLLILLLILASKASYAQFDESLPNIQNILLAGSKDAEKLLGHYTSPIFKGFINNLNSGWYSTAKTHRLFGFDISLTGNVAFVPKEAGSFELNPDDYEFVTTPSRRTEIYPTIFGDNMSRQLLVEIEMDNGNVQKAPINLQGRGTEIREATEKATSYDFIPIPLVMLQGGVGLPLNTDLKFRLSPSFGYNGFSGKLFGLGVQHDLLQYFRPAEGRKSFNLSGLFGFTTINLKYPLEFSTATNGVNVLANSKLGLNVNTWTTQLVASLDVLYLVTVYGSLGYNSGSSSVYLKGNYELNYDLYGPDGAFISKMPPIKTDKELSVDAKSSGARYTLGARLNLAFFKVFLDYTVQEYSVLNGGFSFSFDWPKFSGANNEKQNSNTPKAEPLAEPEPEPIPVFEEPSEEDYDYEEEEEEKVEPATEPEIEEEEEEEIPVEDKKEEEIEGVTAPNMPQ